MDTLYTFTLPDGQTHQMMDTNDDDAIRRLQERLDLDTEEGEEKITLTPQMITERVEKPGVDEFLEKYTLVQNPENEGSGEPASALWETFSPEIDVVRAAFEKDPRTVWTLIEEDGIEFIVPGMRRVNRLNYFITNEPRESEDESYIYCD